MTMIMPPYHPFPTYRPFLQLMVKGTEMGCRSSRHNQHRDTTIILHQCGTSDQPSMMSLCDGTTHSLHVCDTREMNQRGFWLVPGLFLNFILCKSEEDSTASKNSSDGWDKENRRVRHDLTAQAKAAAIALNTTFFHDIHMNKLKEWEQLAEERNTDDETIAKMVLQNLRQFTFTTKRPQAKA